jgi:hypothetical protein
MVYFTRLWQRIYGFSALPFRIDRWLFRLPQGWRLSFQFAVKYTVDNAGEQPPVFSVSSVAANYGI